MAEGESVITASTVKVSTMSDDTLRLVIDIEPMHAQEAFALFGQRGSPVVIARLTQEAALQDAQQQTEKPKGGPLAKLAGQWCADPFFREWYGATDAEHAANMMRKECDIDSRAELDHDEFAAEVFHKHIREPFRLHCKDAGIEL